MSLVQRHSLQSQTSARSKSLSLQTARTLTSQITDPLFTVVGATSAQGASTIRALQASTKAYHVLAITRDPSKSSSKELEDFGCKLVQADIEPALVQQRLFLDPTTSLE
ncbi:hypothetical protein CPB83DRAFT_892360 [Crepidotus variabilis]|uniref:NmrA-like domain-containing protein n=1 Tax=Crepidotus variabilis TaxID=179855 RepID=A0A9P6JRX9_9AGAR|nr:hypothetical protein CPB83DRAFT_892360 [Crepidotus variabilis]